MDPQKTAWKNQAQSIIKGLEKRNMEGYYCETGEEAVAKAMSFVEDGACVAWGGSETLKVTGMMDRLKADAQRLKVIDRDLAKTPEEKREVYFKCSAADYYFMSANAITKDGVLVNIDGSGNRVACLVFGPRTVILLVGMNKVTVDVESAVQRARNVAAPPNVNRLGLKTPCAQTGFCGNCNSEGCICSDILITRHNRDLGRIKVILIGEAYGY